MTNTKTTLHTFVMALLILTLVTTELKKFIKLKLNMSQEILSISNFRINLMYLTHKHGHFLSQRLLNIEISSAYGKNVHLAKPLGNLDCKAPAKISHIYEPSFSSPIVSKKKVFGVFTNTGGCTLSYSMMEILKNFKFL